jgi:ATP-dependent Clp protease, protease subunit
MWSEGPILDSMDLPVITASTAMTPGGDVFDRLLKERIVFLNGQVTDDSAINITAKLLLLDAEDPERDIYLYINSPGGSVYAGMAIYDTMQFVRPDVSTICMGMAASMGQFLLCAGTKGKRFSLPHGRILMHQPLGQMQGQASDIAIHAENMLRTKKEMAELIAHHTGQPFEQISADSDRDRWFTAQQALDYGMIDEIVARNPGGLIAPNA